MNEYSDLTSEISEALSHGRKRISYRLSTTQPPFEPSTYVYHRSSGIRLQGAVNYMARALLYALVRHISPIALIYLKRLLCSSRQLHTAEPFVPVVFRSHILVVKLVLRSIHL